MDEHIFHIEGLTHQFADGTFALKGLSLTIQQGKKIALLGNNGAGKSTLFLHLNGLLQPTAGKIRFKGKKMKYDRKALLSLRKQVGIVFQDPDSQLFSANVQQDISFGPMNLGWDRNAVQEKVNWAMAETEVTELKDRPTHFLSLGQKKTGRHRRGTCHGTRCLAPGRAYRWIGSLFLKTDHESAGQHPPP